MKTAKEHHDEFYAASGMSVPELVRLVQADALRHAAGICSDMWAGAHATTAAKRIREEATRLEKEAR